MDVRIKDRFFAYETKGVTGKPCSRRRSPGLSMITVIDGAAGSGYCGRWCRRGTGRYRNWWKRRAYFLPVKRCATIWCGDLIGLSYDTKGKGESLAWDIARYLCDDDVHVRSGGVRKPTQAVCAFRCRNKASAAILSGETRERRGRYMGKSVWRRQLASYAPLLLCAEFHEPGKVRNGSELQETLPG